MMGAQIVNQGGLTITGPDQLLAPKSKMDCGGSGTTLRIFSALSALTHGRCILTGNKSLQARPMTELLQALNQLGINASSIRNNGKPPIEVSGRGIEGGVVRIRGDVSSQYISGLLFSCAKAENETKIEITTKLESESQPYVEMTLEVMQQFGVMANPSRDWTKISIPAKQQYIPSEYEIPGDYSSAAVLLIAGVLCGRVRVNGLTIDTKQGDSHIVTLLQKMGVQIDLTKSGYAVSHSEPLSIDIDVSNTPDLVPILAVLASQAKGRTRIFNASRLRFKESDRLATTTMELRKMGAQIDSTEDGIIIEGPTPLRGSEIDSHHDHRIAMACTVAGLIAKSPTEIMGVECVAKSYPDFIEHMQSLGANIELEDNNKGRMKRL
jgi:3-phosphoshikimate 1-carboxyvinyltransferase